MSVNTVTLALELAVQLLVQSQRISQLVLAAQSVGRDLTAEEWDAITSDADKARQALVNAIDKAKSEGR